MYRFLLSRRWVGFALFVLVLSGVCVRLGFWQMHRHDERVAANAVTRTNLAADPVDVASVAGGSRDDNLRNAWRQVQVTGTYDTSAQVLVKYQTRDAGPGVDVITPLRTTDGRAVLVERGWVQAKNNAGTQADVPEPPSGTVTVVGWWQANQKVPLDATKPEDGTVRGVSTEGIAPTLDYPLYDGGYVALEKQDPETQGLAAVDGPDLGQGPHFFYAIQWWFFAGLALLGYVWFAYNEAHPGRKRGNATRPGQRAMSPAEAAAYEAAVKRRREQAQLAAAGRSETLEHASVDGQHDTGDVRRGG